MGKNGVCWSGRVGGREWEYHYLVKLRLSILTYGYPREKFVYVQHRSTKVFMAVLPVIAKTGKRPVILTVEYVNNLCYIKTINSIVKIN